MIDPGLERLREMVARAREQLSDAQADYMREKARVAALQSELFQLLREEYQRRDTLRLLVHSRRAQIAALSRGDRHEATAAEAHFSEQKARVDREYESTASEFAGRRKLDADEKAEIATL